MVSALRSQSRAPRGGQRASQDGFHHHQDENGLGGPISVSTPLLTLPPEKPSRSSETL